MTCVSNCTPCAGLSNIYPWINISGLTVRGPGNQESLHLAQDITEEMHGNLYTTCVLSNINQVKHS